MVDFRVATVADNYDATVAFYQDALGLTTAATWDDPDGRGVMFSVNNAILEVLEANEHHPFSAPVGVVVGIEYNDVDELYERMKRSGIHIEETIADRPWGDRSFLVLAPNGLKLSFFKVLTES